MFEETLGKLPGEVHLGVDSNINPHIAIAGRVPVAIKGVLKTELERLVGKEVFEPVNGPKGLARE